MQYIITLIAALVTACAPVPHPTTYRPGAAGAAHHVDVFAPQIKCSGVLVAPDRVLTAAHCVGDRTVVLPRRGDAVGVTEARIAEGWDVAILVLATPVAGAPAVFGPAAQPGDVLTSYGRCPPPVKRLRVGGAMMGWVVAVGPEQICPGDSGGGWYDGEGRLTAITSARTTGPGARQSAAVDVVRLGLEALIGE